MHAVGVAPEPIPHKNLIVGTLAEAISRAVVDSLLRNRAEELGARIRAENGVLAAVHLEAIHSGRR